MKQLIILFFGSLLSLSLVGQSAISPSAGTGKTSEQIIVDWAVGELIIGLTYPDKNRQEANLPIIPTSQLNPLDGNFSESTLAPASIGVFPNPAKDRVSIEFNNFKTPFLAFRILTADGQEVFQQKVADSDQTVLFDVSTFTTGTYILQASEGTQGVVTKKLFVF